MYRSTQNDRTQRNRFNQSLGNSTVNRNHTFYHQENKFTIKDKLREQFKKSWLTTIIGLLLFVTGICVLVWNEGRAVKMSHSIDEALRNVIVVQNNFKLIPEFENHLVYLSGPISVSEPLTETDYGVMVASVKLKKRAQMYQWIEMEEDRSYPGSTEIDKHYYYSTDWRDELVDSNSFYIKFGHENPSDMPIKSQIQTAEEVKIGGFILGSELKDKFNDYIEVTSDERPERIDIKMHSGLYYHSNDLWNPQVGDIRVQISFAGKAGDIFSVIGKLKNGVLVPYISSHGQEILFHRKNEVSIEQMLHLEHVDNYWKTWIIRGLGWLVMFLAATCLASILKIIILNSKFLCGIIAMESFNITVSISLSLLVIGLAWIWYRPFIGLSLTLASLLPFLYSTMGSSSTSPHAMQQQRDDYRRL